MKDINQVVNQTKEAELRDSPRSSSSDLSSESGEINKTDPIVCHDPSIKIEGIARIYTNQNKRQMDEYELSDNNVYEATKIDGIEYPLITINDRNVENNDIINMQIMYKDFLPSIVLTIIDIHQTEQKINTTQMSSIIRVCMVAKVDNIYRKFLMNFRTYDVQISASNSAYVTYYGKMYIEGFRQVNTKHIWMKEVCPAENCGQGGHINANTWEMLHKIAEMTGLGFAATKQCKEIPDHLIRNIYSQRYDQYIEQQLLHCGTDEDNIFDAWVDLYGYIVMVNVPWIMTEEIKPSDLKITAITGIHGTTNDTPENKIIDVDRTLTNYNLMVTASNMEISKFNMVVNNNSIKHGTLERVYTYNFDTNITTLDPEDIQSKQDSIDGDFIEDYNTGKNRPIPKFNFNDDAWTGLEGGYDINKQKIIRNSYFRKKRQSVFNVELKEINLGLQRGTLVNIMIFDNDSKNKKHTFDSVDNLFEATDEADVSKYNMPPHLNQIDLSIDGGLMMPNFKLSGLYYIDGMSFEYKRQQGRIVQTLFLIKKGKTSGYENRHTSPRLPLDKIKNYSKKGQSEPYLTKA